MEQVHEKGFYEKIVKRPQDFLLSLIALILLSPVLLLVAALVRAKLGSPVIFKQERPGYKGKIFTLYKFRSMTDKKDENGELLPDDVRLTPFGQKLRSTSLDELPELFNIIKGDMAIIGPRPQLVKDMVFMNQEQIKRHQVRPGLTGLAQINGRNNITWEQKFDYDLQYIDKGIKFSKDLQILFITVGKVLNKSDVVRNGTLSDMDFGDWLLNEKKISQEEYNKKQQEALDLIKYK